MSSEDSIYYRERASTERAQAAAAPTAEIAAVHQKLADLYESLTERLEQSQAGQDVAPISEAGRQAH